MRVLSYVEPLPEKRPLWKQGWLDFVARFVDALRSEDPSEDEFALVVSDALAPLAGQRFSDIRIVEIQAGELIPAFGASALEAATRWYRETADPEATARMVQILADRLGGFEADVCVTLSPAPFLKALFPKAAVLNFEYGMLSRAPFPETGFLDPLGIYDAGALSRYRKQIKAFRPTPREAEALASIRDLYTKKMQGEGNPLRRVVPPLLKGKRAAILLALQFSDFYCYNAHAQLPEQGDFLRHVLETTPPDVAVIACEHPEHPLFDEATLDFYRKRFPNLIWAPEFRSVYASGQYLIEYADAVVTVSSSVGLQAPLWRKKLIVLGSSHLDVFADAHSMQDLERVLDRPWDAARDGALAWLLTRYYQPFDTLFDPVQLRAQFERAIEEAGQPRPFAAFKPTTTPRRLVNIYARAAEQMFSPYTSPSDRPDLLNAALFSATAMSAFSEQTCARATVRLGDKPASIILSTPDYGEPLQSLRIRLSDRPRQFFLHSLTVRGPAGEPLWTWSGQAAELAAAPGLLAIAIPERQCALVDVLTSSTYLDIPLKDMDTRPTSATVEIVISEASLWDAANVRAVVHHRASEKQELLAAVGQSKSEAHADAERINAALADLHRKLDQQHEELTEALRRGDERGGVMMDRVLDSLEADIADRLGDRIDRANYDSARLIAESQRSDSQALVDHTLGRLEPVLAGIASDEFARRVEQAGLDIARMLDESLGVITSRGVETVQTFGERLGEVEASLKARTEDHAGAIATALAAIERRMSATEARIEEVISARSAINEQFDRSAWDIARSLEESQRRLAEQINTATARDVSSTTAALADRIHLLEQRIADLVNAEKALDMQRREVIELKTEVDALRSSTSWRVTAPIRALGGLLGRKTRPQVRAEAPPAPQPPPPPVAAAPADSITPPPAPMMTVQTAPRRAAPASAPSASDYVPMGYNTPPSQTQARAIAFYLPQFHPIPENDAWWGKGFTEWTNVTKATPQYEGHYQPHLPDELGFYDLRVPEVMERQADLARLYGLEGFCFYFYWFAGKRLLERPLLQWLDNRDIDFPFCLCWANENWSRRWDGLDAEVLIGQQHSPEDDLAFIAYVAKYLRDPRYIRVDGKPMLLVYRPSLFPDAKATAQRWRQWCRENGVGEIHLVLTQSFDMGEPKDYGFDAAVEFPPNNMGPPDITDTLPKLNPDFSGRILDYDFYVTRSAAFPQRSYPVYRSVFPSWDNEARRVGGGSSFHGATPDKFQRMVRNAVRETSNTPAPDQRVIFVNAWNEWAEGCHLEPDRRYGYAWLEALRKGLEGEAAAEPTQLPSPPRAQPKPVAAPMPAAAAAGIGPRGDRLILVVHDAYRHGAQYLALNMARFMSQQLKLGLDIVILGDGPLKPDFAAYGVVHDLAGVDPLGESARRLAQRLRANGAAHAICNTTVAGLFLKTLTEAGVACIALIHELPGLIASYRLENHLHTIQQQAKLTVYSSSMLRDRLNAPADKPAIVRTQGLYKRNPARTPEERAAARVRLRRHFRLPGNARIVLGVGYGDLRKGVDLWVDIGKRVMAAHPDAYFLWVGEIESTQVAPLKSWLAASGASDRFLFAGFQADTADFYAGADVYALTSREDPFPTVIMEALDVAVPVVGFEGAGGFTELLHSGVGVTAPMLDTAVFAKAVSEILIDEGARQRMGERGMETVQAEYGFGGYCFDLLSYVGFGVPRVSVVVPNYNYARHLKDRFATVLDQAGGVYELIVLDDCSPDDSIDVARRLLAHEETDWRLIVNTKNSGSPCRQWLKGVEQAKGDIVWIAEADDLTLPGFLEELLPAFRDPDVAMAYCQSKQMAGDGAILCDHYLDYVADIDREKWRRSHVSGGLDEIRTVLAVKNAIPNVSACLFRREALLRALSEGIDDIASYRVAGDWATYVRVLEQGKLAFSARPLNLHRRHENSVTLGSQHEKLLREILSMQQTVRRRHAVPTHVQAIQRAYAQELYQQFGFPEAGPPAVDSHPAFAQYFDKVAKAAE